MRRFAQPIADLHRRACAIPSQKKEFLYGRLGVPGSSTRRRAFQHGGSPRSMGLVGTFRAHSVDYRAVAQYRFERQLHDLCAVLDRLQGRRRSIRVRSSRPRPCRTIRKRSTAYEIGFKSDFLDRTVRAQRSALHQQVQRYPRLRSRRCPLHRRAPPAPCALPLNAGTADVKGFEAELDARSRFDGLLDRRVACLSQFQIHLDQRARGKRRHRPGGQGQYIHAVAVEHRRAI